MRGWMSMAGQVVVTAGLCAACWWIWSSSFSLAGQLHIGELDLVVRVLQVFALLSLADWVSERLRAARV